MRREARLVLVASCLAAVFSLPAVSAHGPATEAVYKFTDVGEATGWSNATLDQAASQGLLNDFDRDGDDRIDEEQAQPLESFLETSGEDAEARTAWSGQAPAQADVQQVEAPNAVGPIADDERLHIHSVSTLTYPADPGAEAYGWERATETADEDRHLKVEAPPGYQIADHEGVDQAQRDGGWLEGQTSSEERVAIVFTAEDAVGERDAPAASALALMASLGVASSIADRLRRRSDEGS